MLLPTELEDVIVRIPGIPLIDFSSGSVIWLSIISAFAPAYEVITVTKGGSMAGYSRIPKKLNPITPKRIRVKLITVASTGLLSESSDIFTLMDH